METWLSLKSIFNSRPSPSLAPTTAHDWPFTLAMFRHCFCCGPACREETVGWMLSHPHTDLWATMFQDLFLDSQPLETSSWWTVYALLSQTHSTHTHFISCPDPTLLAIVLTHKHKHWHWAVSQSTSADTVSLSGITLVISPKCVSLWDFPVMSTWLMYPASTRRSFVTSSCLKARWRVCDVTAKWVWKQDNSSSW